MGISQPNVSLEGWTGLNILVTGCAGFIGSKVASLLLDMGHTVWGVDNLTQPHHSCLQRWRLNTLRQRPGFTFHRLDISDPEPLKPIFQGGSQRGQVSRVINLGALAGVRGSVANPRAYYETNVLGTLNLLELCREFGVGKFVLASTSSVYGGGVTGPIAEDAPSSQPLSPYAASKKAAETLLHSYHHLYGIDAMVLRYFTVYGPAGRPDMSIFKFIRSVTEDEPITIYGDGTQQRDFTYVNDVARGTAAALALSGYEAINLGNGRPVALNDIIRMIEDAVGQSAQIQYQERHPADPMMTWANISRARNLLGWVPVVGIEEGIRRTVEWYMVHRHWAKTLS